jgi:2,3-bisphosphoglycerate-independent phosphoglycerate mutase
MKNIKIDSLVVLAAGLGSRLKPLTDEMPKCLTEINGQPMLIQTLKAFEQNGIRKATIVVGYFGQTIKETIGEKIGNMSVEYIDNDIFDETNSSYSAWLASKELSNGAFLVEGDTIYDEKIIEDITAIDDGNAYWIVDRFTEKRDGCMLIVDKHEKIVDLRIVRQSLHEYKKSYFKSCGLLRITPDYGKQLVNWLDEEISNGNVTVYYDLVIQKHLNEKSIYIHNIEGKKWEEVDNLEDLMIAESIFEPPKHVIIVIDGAADRPLEKLGGKTPLEYAKIPSIDALAKSGKCGLMKTMLNGLPVGSIVANMGILGYNPMRYYPNGRASFEALAKGIFLGENDIAFRCNIVSIREGILTDFTAGNISDELGKIIIAEVAKHFPEVEIYPGQSYRNTFILRNCAVSANEIKCMEPHMNIGSNINALDNYAVTTDAEKTVKFLNHFVSKSREIISGLKSQLQCEADGLFIWSPSSSPRLPSLHKKYSIDGAVVSAMDFLHGIAKSARMEYSIIPGATGYSDTDLEAKLNATIRFLKNNDLVFLHINGPDEESHGRNLDGKINILERIDAELITPLLEHLESNYSMNYRISIMPDHYTYVENGKHDDKLVPYLVFGNGIEKDEISAFSETEINKLSRSIIKNYEFMNYFLKR